MNKMKRLLLGLMALPTLVFAGTITRPNTYTAGDTIRAADVNLNESTIYSEFNGNINNANILDGGIATADLAAGAVTLTKLEAPVQSTFTLFNQLLTYRRPNLTWVSITLVDVENNTPTQNQTCIVFPDERRCVTEDTSSTNKYRRFDITVPAQFTTGTEDSGLTGNAEATNTWYAIYAVKSLINTSNFVISGTTVTPTQSNVSSLNSMYGTNSWVYLGMIRNGDNSGATGDILAFTMGNGVTQFTNAVVTTVGNAGYGIKLSTVASATTLTYTYQAGTGTVQIPAVVTTVQWFAVFSARTAATFAIDNAAGNADIKRFKGSDVAVNDTLWAPAAAGIQVYEPGTNSSNAYYIGYAGFVDKILSGGFVPTN